MKVYKRISVWDIRDASGRLRALRGYWLLRWSRTNRSDAAWLAYQLRAIEIAKLLRVA